MTDEEGGQVTRLGSLFLLPRSATASLAPRPCTYKNGVAIPATFAHYG